MSEKSLETHHLTWKVLRLTEKAITLLESGLLDDALAVVDNRERALNLLSTRADIGPQDALILQEIDKLNNQLLAKFLEARQELQKEISTTHKQGNAHRAYQPNPIK